MSDHNTTATKRVDSISNFTPQPCGSARDTQYPRTSRLHELESELKKIRQESHRERVAYNQKNDPLSGMPSELMSLIFHFAIDYQHHKTEGIVMFCMESARVYIRPIWLASVCTRWRRIALADPSLWSLIHIVYRGEVDPLGRRSWTPSLELVQQWLSRSGVLPLRIKLIWYKAPESEDETLRRIIEALCEQCHRWRSLYIRVPPDAMAYFQCAASDRIIDLDHLCIDHDEVVGRPLKMGYTTLRPRHVSLHRPPWAAKSSSWTSTVTLRISDASPTESLNIIMHTSQLEELDLNFVRPRVDGDVSALVEPVTASRLRTMRVAFIANEDLEEFFMFVRAPELESLDLVRFMDQEIHVPLDFLEPLLLQSGNRLRSLSLRSITFSTEDLLDLLSALHELSYLKMDFGFKEVMALAPRLDGLFGRLLETSTDNAVTFLPRLSHLIYSGSRTFMWSSFADVLCAHATVDNPSKRLLQILGINLVPSLVPENYVDKETLNRLLALQRSKMTVRVSIDELLIQASFEHHGIVGAPFPLLFRPWNTYNLTPSFSLSS